MVLTKFLSGNYPIEEFAAVAILHDHVHVSVVDVALVKLNDVWVIQIIQSSNFVDYQIYVLAELLFVHHLDSNPKVLIVLVSGHEHFAKTARSKHLGLRIYTVILLQLVNALAVGVFYC